jgi:hypothetical protein
MTDSRTSLVIATKLVSSDEAGWFFRLLPDAAEGGGYFRSALRQGIGPGLDVDPERAGREAGRRARTEVRRYAAANRLNRLGTLTYRGAGCFDPQTVRRDAGRFFRGLSRALGGKRFPYVWVPEWHPKGHGLHVHFAVGRFIGQRMMERTWGHGWVHIVLIGDVPVGAGVLGESRKAGRYLAKYVGKDFASGRVAGLHRYEVGQGFQPRHEIFRGVTVELVLAAASDRMKEQPSYVWHSSEVVDWQGPPAVMAQWL